MNNFISPEINSNFSIFPEQAPIPPIPTAQELFVQRQDGTASSWKQGLFSLLTRVDAIIESKPMFALGIGAICAFTVSSMGLIIIPVGLPGSAIILFAVCRLVTCLFNQIIIKNHDHYLLERFSANGCPLPEKQALLAAASPQMRQEHRGQLQNQVDAYCAAKAEERRVAGQLTEALEYAHRIDAKELRATALKPIHRDLGDRNAGLLVEIETSELVSCPRNVLDVMLEACKYIEEPILRDTCRVKILEAFYTRELAEATMHGKKQLLQALFRYSSSAVSSHGMQYEPGVSPISPNCIESRQKLQELWITILEIASRPDPNTDEKFVQFLFALLPRIDALYLPAKKTQAVLPMVAAKLVILPAQIFASFLQLEHIIQKTTLDIALDMIMMMPPASRSGALNQLQQKINSMNLNANLKQYLQPILDW